MSEKSDFSIIEKSLDTLNGKEEILINDFSFLSEFKEKGFDIIVLDMKQGYKYPKYIKDERLIDLQEQIKAGKIQSVDQLGEDLFSQIFENYEVIAVKDKVGNDFGVFVKKDVVYLELLIEEIEGITVAVDGRKPEAIAKINPLVLKIGNNYKLQVYQNGKEIHTEDIVLQTYESPTIKVEIDSLQEQGESSNLSTTPTKVGDSGNVGGVLGVALGIVLLFLLSKKVFFKQCNRYSKVEVDKEEIDKEEVDKGHVQKNNIIEAPSIKNVDTEELSQVIRYIEELIARKKEDVKSMTGYSDKRQIVDTLRDRIDRYEGQCRSIQEDIQRVPDMKNELQGQKILGISKAIFIMKKNLCDLNEDIYHLKEIEAKKTENVEISEITEVLKKMLMHLTLEIHMVKECVADMHSTQQREIERYMQSCIADLKGHLEQNIEGCINGVTEKINVSIEVMEDSFKEVRERLIENNKKTDAINKKEIYDIIEESQKQINSMVQEYHEELKKELVAQVKSERTYRISPIAEKYQKDTRVCSDIVEMIEDAECVYMVLQNKKGIKDYSTVCLAYVKVLEVLVGQIVGYENKTLGQMLYLEKKYNRDKKRKHFFEKLESSTVITLRNKACHKERVSWDEALRVRSFLLENIESLIS